MDRGINRKAIELRHLLHQIPEISGQERETKGTLLNFLTRETSLTVTDCGKWFYAVKKGSRPEKQSPIAFRADMDALPIEEYLTMPYASTHPGVSHKCGHDGHSTVLAALAMELDRRETDRDIYLIFQHAEEIGAGGEGCAQLLREKGVGEVYAFHNWSGFPRGSILLKAGTAQCASQGLTVKFTGITAHAGQPEDGINPACALAQLTLFTEELAGVQKMNSPESAFDGLTMATIVGTELGSKNFGIAASYGEFSVTLRAELEKDLRSLRQQILKKAEELAVRYRLQMDFEECDIFPETNNDERIIRKVKEAALKQGREVIELEKPFRVSEDFGWYQKVCPGAMVYVGNGVDYPALHTREYDFCDENLEVMTDLWLEICGQ